jgi:hypothetical protein
MFNQHYEMIAIQKQNEIEQNAKDAWKYDTKTNKSPFQRIGQMIKAFHVPTKANYDQRTCEVC